MTLNCPDWITELDQHDPLASYRSRFLLPENLIYLDGNSLGALPAATLPRLQDVIAEEWGEELVRSWNSRGWIDAPLRVGGKIAGLIGAQPHEVVVADSTSANIFKLLAAATALRPERHVILSEPGNFPTDLYMVQGFAAFSGRHELRTMTSDKMIEAIDESVAVVLLTQVHYKTAHKYDMAAITARAHAVGALVIWDLSHSAGAIEVDLNGANADFAVGCGYKYLNGGPGAPAFLFVAERWQAQIQSPLSGWMGHAAPFDFVDRYQPAPSIARMLCGTPSILGLSALEQGVDLMCEAGMPALAAKGQALASLFIDTIDARCAGLGLELVTSRDPAARGSHVSFRHPQAFAICQALIARGVIGDFRAPDILRFGFASIYLRYADVWHSVDALHEVLAEQAWDHADYQQRGKVT